MLLNSAQRTVFEMDERENDPFYANLVEKKMIILCASRVGQM